MSYPMTTASPGSSVALSSWVKAAPECLGGPLVPLVRHRPADVVRLHDLGQIRHVFRSLAAGSTPILSVSEGRPGPAQPGSRGMNTVWPPPSGRAGHRGSGRPVPGRPGIGCVASGTGGTAGARTVDPAGGGTRGRHGTPPAAGGCWPYT